MRNFIIILIIFLIIDGVWLNLFAGPMFAPIIKNIQKEPIELKLEPAIITYLLLAYGVYYFSRFEDNNISDKQKILNASLFGLLAFGIFDFTNMAILKNYDLNVAIIDTLWGFFVSGLVVFLSLQIKNFKQY